MALCGASAAAFSGASTFAVGKVVSDHFARGGDLTTFHVEAEREGYREALRKANSSKI